jgi:hypothetical protein
MNNLIESQLSLASRANLSDSDLLRIVQAGSGGWLRGIAKRVQNGSLSESMAVNLIMARAEAVSVTAKIPAVILIAYGLALKLRGLNGKEAS